MQSVRRIERNPGRAVSWEPTHDVYFLLADMLRTSHAVPALYVAQGALQRVDTLLRDGDVPMPFGLLAGNRYAFPGTQREYLLIDEVLPAHIEPTSESMIAELVRELRDVATSVEQRGLLPIGWYLGGADVLERVAREDVALHCAIFPQPWQVMLVRDGVDGRRHGAFVRIEPSDQRPYAIRFFELLPDSVISLDRVPRTVIRWENYRTKEQVVPIEESAPEHRGRKPKKGVLQRLSELRRNWATPRRTASTPNDTPPSPPDLEPASGDTDAPGAARSTAEQDARIDATGAMSAPPVVEAPPPVVDLPAVLAHAAAPVVESDVGDARRTSDDRGTELYTNRIVRVPPPKSQEPAEIRLAIERITLNQGESVQLAPSVVDGAGTVVADIAVTFSSSDSSIVPVSPSGLASSIGPPGTAAVTVSAGSLVRVVPIVVVAVETSLEVRPSVVRLPQHGSQQLEARLTRAPGFPVSAVTFTYTSSDPSIVSVSASGLVNSVGPAGVASITVQSGMLTFVVQLTVTQEPTRLLVIPNPAGVTVGIGRRLTARVLDAVGVEMKGSILAFSSSNPAIIAVSSDGVLTAAGPYGQARVTVRVLDTSLSTDVVVNADTGGIGAGRIATNISIPGGFCAVVVSAREAYVAPVRAPIARVDLATNSVSAVTGSEGGLGIACCRARGEVYAAAYSTNTIDVISTDQGAVIATIDFPDRVLDIVVAEEAQLAYLGLGSGIAVLDLQTRSISLVDVPVLGLHLALHPSRPLLYVSGNALEVREIDLRAAAVTRSFALTSPGFGQAVAVTADGSSLYVANESAELIDEFDLTSGAHVRAIELPSRGVWGIAITPDGKTIFVSGAAADGLVSVDTATGNVLQAFPSTGGYRLTLSADGFTLLAAGAGSGLLVVR